jgi:fluoroquinolone resistance protein
MITTGDYEKCSFDYCIFSNANLSDIHFINCQFKHCDFTLAKVTNAAFGNVTFIGCKLLGVRFEECNKFGFSANFQDCQLKHSSFYKQSLKNTNFKECNLQEVDFSESNLTAVKFDNCDLSGAIFKNTVLEKSDFRTAYNFSINPEINRMKKAKFSIPGIVGLLDKYKIEIE